MTTSSEPKELSFTRLVSDSNQHVATIVTVSKGRYTPDQVSTISARAVGEYSQYAEHADPVVRHPVGRIAILATLLHEIEADGLLSSVQLARYVAREVQVAGTRGDAMVLETFTLRTLDELQRTVNQLRRDVGVVGDGVDAGEAKRGTYPPVGAEWPRWLDVEWCAAYISRSKRSIQGLVDRCAIPHIKHESGRVMFDRHAVDKWMERPSKRRRSTREQ